MKSNSLKPKMKKAMWIEDRFWAYVEGQIVVIEDQKNRPRIKSQNITVAQAQVLTAPMPGRITKLLAKEGDPVEPGQLVVMMEAMKMEYSLRMPVAGSIKRVHVQVGDQVSLGQVLVEW